MRALDEIDRGTTTLTPQTVGVGCNVTETTLTLRLDNTSGRFRLVPDRGQRVVVSITLPRPWWRRLLRRPAKQVKRGPFQLERFPTVGGE